MLFSPQILVRRPPQKVSPSVTLPGNVVASALAYWGGEAYNSAYATGSNPCFDVVKASDGTSLTTINITSAGRADVAAINALGFAVKVTKAYDQTGNSQDLTQATLALMPTITISGSNAYMTFASGQYLGKANWHGSVDVAQPYTISAVLKDEGSGVNNGGVVATNTGAAQHALYSVDPSNSGIYLYAGGAGLYVVAPINVFNSFSAVFNSTSSDANINGTVNTGDTTTGALYQNGILLGTDLASSSTANFVGKIGRAGVWPSAFSPANSSSMSTNDHIFWGF